MMKKTGVVLLALVLAGAVILLWSRPVKNHKPSVEEPQKSGQAPAAVPAVNPAVSSPFRVSFSPGGPGKLAEPAALDLVVEFNPDVRLPELTGESELELLLRLPPGVKLHSAEWEPVRPSAQEEKDSSGPWNLFEKKIPVTLPASASGEIARERVELAVMEPGINWIVTTRARITNGEKGWQTFGVIFATVGENQEVEFHPIPKAIQTEQRAEADRS